jgi:hypothetical protein
VESSCEFGIEPSGSVKCWETMECLTTGGLSSSVPPHRVRFSLLIICSMFTTESRRKEFRHEFHCMAELQSAMPTL